MFYLVLTCALVVAVNASPGFSSSQASSIGGSEFDQAIYQAPSDAHLAAIRNGGASGYTSTYASPDGFAYGYSSLGSDYLLAGEQATFHQQLQQHALNHAARIQAQVQQQILASQQQNYPGGASNYGNSGGYGAPNGGGPNYAGASASIGPDGVYHSGYINPPNPASPNFETRFDASPGNGGSYGVQTNSYSSSSNVDGVQSSKRGSSTSVNDNGKITTYSTQS